ncbi:MAG: adenylosuccinate synthase [Anaerolineaceae bacterium 4572_78]|nr:MAG: adenylosuccinate synthase [Anaerolineaceae bacterium 4572_78]
MAVKTIIGAQWGDEGKGRVVDYLAQQADIVIRFQGGDNAGHTVVIGKAIFKLHLVPSGIFNPKTTNLINTGCVVNPESLLQEIANLEEAGINTTKLFISDRAHVVMPYHRILDGLQETSRHDKAIGTTKRGIGPAYADKAARRGIRMGDLLKPVWLKERLSVALEHANREITHFDGNQISFDAMYEQCQDWGQKLSNRIIDPTIIVRTAYKANKTILLEGQLGAMRDLDWGIYPYVTSSNPTATYALSGAGLPHNALSDVIGVVKAYSTAVGAGPFPTELADSNGEYLRETGNEYGATTGRPRRCGWLDGVAIRHASWLNGFTAIAITKLDVLDDLESMQICTHYRLPNGELVGHMPDTPILETVVPIYETWRGWQQPTTQIREWANLPQNAKHYLKRISELAQAPIIFVSVGAERDSIITIKNIKGK